MLWLTPPFYRYERQVAKDEDDELRRELDKELPNLKMMLAGHSATHTAKDTTDKADTSTPLGINKDQFVSDFDRRLKQLVHDRRSQPTNRTKTEEEKAQEESERLKELEEKRLKRMRGESVSDDSSDDDDKDKEKDGQEESAIQFFPAEEEEDWGLGSGIKAKKYAADFSDEDSFIIDDDLVASGSDLEPVDSDFDDEEDEDLSGNDQGQDEDEESDDEFTKGLLTEEEARSSVFAKGGPGGIANGAPGPADELPYSFPCPQNYDEFVTLAGQYPVDKLPTIV